MKGLFTYYIEESYSNEQYTASIVRKDNEVLLAEEGFKPIRFTQTKDNSFAVKISRLINATSVALKTQKNSLVVFHFPLLANAYSLLHTFLKWRGIKTVTFIIDIDGLRYNDAAKLKKELHQLEKFNYIIAHNAAMKNFIQQHIPQSTVFTIDLFDYPVKESFTEKTFSKTVCIAANHGKGGFVYKLNELSPVQFNLYGEGYDEKLQTGATNVHYKGIVPPDLLPTIAEGSFGLVWDGDSISGCDEYLKYNNPHKLSLYIAAGLPVIVWEHSAVALFVKQNGIGITVQSLTGLNEALDTVTENEYERMKQNTIATREKIRKGYYLKTALTKILSKN